MSLISYGDTFYIYAATQDGTYQGWISRINNSTKNSSLAMYNNNANTSTASTVDPIKFTIYPATIIKGTVCVPTNSSSQFLFPTNSSKACASLTDSTRSKNLLNFPVLTNDNICSYIGTSDTLNQSEWTNLESFIGAYSSQILWNMSLALPNADIALSIFSPESVNTGNNETVCNSNNPDAQCKLFYGSPLLMGFRYQVKTCAQGTSQNATKGMFYLNTDSDSSGWYSIVGDYYSKCNPSGPLLYFYFIPTNPFIMVNGRLKPFDLSTFTSVYQIPDSLFYSGTDYGCIQNSCMAGSGINYPYNQRSACITKCSSVDKVKYVCNGDGTCSQATGTETGTTYGTKFGCEIACAENRQKKYACINGACNPGRGTNYIYDTLDQCNSGCTIAPTPSTVNPSQNPTTAPQTSTSERIMNIGLAVCILMAIIFIIVIVTVVAVGMHEDKKKNSR